jgi:hypothetical protein
MDEAHQILAAMPDESIYSGNRLAQPDEVWNFGLGDGLEKAFVLMNYMKAVHPDFPISLEANNSEVFVAQNNQTYRFPSAKKLTKKILIKDDVIEEF